MATFTPNKGYPQPVVGADLNVWGTELNAGTSILDNNLGGTTSIAFTGNNVTASTAQAQCLIQVLTGALTANVTYILPATGGFYYVENNTTGPWTIAVASSGGGAIVVMPQGQSAWLVCDGTNIFTAAGPTLVTKVGVNVAGGANITATNFSFIQQLYGTLTANITYTLPATFGLYEIQNNTSGNFTLTIACAGGTGTTVVPQNQCVLVFCDSLNITPATPLVPTSEITVSMAGNNVSATVGQAGYLIQNLTGALTGPASYVLPQFVGFFCVINATTGPWTLNVASIGGGRSVPVAQNLAAWLWTDGTNVFPANPGWTEIVRLNPSGQASVTMPLPTSFSRFRVTLQNGQVSATSGLSLRVSNNGGTSFVSTASYVLTAIGFNTTAPSTPAGNGNTAATAIPFTAASAGGSGTAMDATMEIWPGAGSVGASFRGNNFVSTAGGAFQQTYVMASAGVVGVNAINIFPAAGGTLSGTFIVEGLP